MVTREHCASNCRQSQFRGAVISCCLDDNRHSWLIDTAELGERAVIGATAAYAPLAAGELKLFLPLRIGNSADDVRQAIAAKVIGLARSGERNPDILCELALKEIRTGPADSKEVPSRPL
jgi:hypothetical protein